MDNKKQFFNEMLRHRYITIGGTLVFLAIMMALLAPLLTAFDPIAVNTIDRLQGPSAVHLLGTDELGRDVLSRIVYGARVSMEVGLLVVILATVCGTAVGLIAGYFQRVDNLIMRVLDGLMAFPDIIIAVTLAAIWGSGKPVIIAAMSFAYFPRMARIVRGSAISVREMEYVESANAIGCKNSYTIMRYVLPNCISPIIVQGAFVFAAAILGEAALSFLGVGIKPPDPSWGGMVSQGRTFLTIAPWMVLFPGSAIALTVLGLNLLGDGLRDLLDPRLQD